MKKNEQFGVVRYIFTWYCSFVLCDSLLHVPPQIDEGSIDIVMFVGSLFPLFLRSL